MNPLRHTILWLRLLLAALIAFAILLLVLYVLMTARCPCL